MEFEKELMKLFADAIDVQDTIWYSDTETLYDAIVSLHNEIIDKELRQ